MSATATFHLGDLLSFTTGAFVSPGHMSDVHKLAEWITDGPVWTHQLPRLFDPIKAEIEAQHPWITAIAKPEFNFPDSISNDDARELVMSWLQTQSRQYGELHQLTRPDVFGVLHQRDPIDEAVEMVGPDRVITVQVAPDEDGVS
jgi:hypothetical protein